jgi:hypothetical protein
MEESNQLCAPAALFSLRSELNWHTDQTMRWTIDQSELDSRESRKIHLFSKELRSASESNYLLFSTHRDFFPRG